MTLRGNINIGVGGGGSGGGGSDPSGGGGDPDKLFDIPAEDVPGQDDFENNHPKPGETFMPPTTLLAMGDNIVYAVREPVTLADGYAQKWVDADAAHAVGGLIWRPALVTSPSVCMSGMSPVWPKVDIQVAMNALNDMDAQVLNTHPSHWNPNFIFYEGVMHGDMTDPVVGIYLTRNEWAYLVTQTME